MRTSPLLGLLLLAGCPGEAPPTPIGDDEEPLAEVQRVSGKAMDYFVANTPLQDATLATDGIEPPLTATSAPDGAFQFDSVPVGSQIFVSASRMGYRPTRNLVMVADTPVEQDLYLMSTADIDRQYATDGKLPTAGRAFVVAELLRDDGTPMVAVPLIDIKLVDAAGAPVPDVIGPYVFGAAGDIVPVGPTETELHGGKARVAFLDVPPGSFSLQIAYREDDGQTQLLTTPVTTAADGASLVRSGGMRDPGGGTPGTPPANPRFAQDVFPRLQTAANGGRGCVNCHTVGGQAALAPFNALPADVLATLKLKPGLIDLVSPADSLLLTKPLYEPPPLPQNHPNATYVNADDPDYKLILLWIEQGALL